MFFKILNLENNYKKKFILLICFYFILSLTEFISIAAVIPLIGILLDENIIFPISYKSLTRLVFRLLRKLKLFLLKAMN